MKKYMYLFFIFLFIWVAIIYHFSFLPRSIVHQEKMSYNPPEFFLYTFLDIEPEKPKEKKASSEDLILFDLTFEQELFKNSFKKFLSNNWKKFIQYNDQQFCLIRTDKENSSLNFEYCNNYLLKRSIELSLDNLKTSDIFSSIEADFIFKINSIELKELFNDKDSSYINYTFNDTFKR